MFASYFVIVLIVQKTIMFFFTKIAFYELWAMIKQLNISQTWTYVYYLYVLICAKVLQIIWSKWGFSKIFFTNRF